MLFNFPWSAGFARSWTADATTSSYPRLKLKIFPELDLICPRFHGPAIDFAACEEGYNRIRTPVKRCQSSAKLLQRFFEPISAESITRPIHVPKLASGARGAKSGATISTRGRPGQPRISLLRRVCTFGSGPSSVHDRARTQQTRTSRKWLTSSCLSPPCFSSVSEWPVHQGVRRRLPSSKPARLGPRQENRPSRRYRRSWFVGQRGSGRSGARIPDNVRSCGARRVPQAT